MKTGETGHIGEGKKDVAEFHGGRLRVAFTPVGVPGMLEFLPLFLDLGHDTIHGGPVETGPCGPFGNTVGPHEGRQILGNRVQQRTGGGVHALFLFLDRMPVGADVIGRHVAALAEHVRMPPYHFLDIAGDDRPKVEGVFFLIHFNQKQHLENDVSQLFADRLHLAGGDGFGQLVDLLDKIVGQGRRRLFAVPGAAFRRTQPADQGQDVFQAAVGIHQRWFCHAPSSSFILIPNFWRMLWGTILARRVAI